MANFKEGDWVQITPTPDHRWSGWNESNDYFCSRMGRLFFIGESMENPSDPDDDDVKVEVYFGDHTFLEGPQWYWAPFKKRHLIQVSESLAKQYIFDEHAAEETNRFEDIVRRKRDEIFRYIFSKPEHLPNDIKEEELVSFELEDTI
jgi:hypothetical protein